jgi:hypothetical protein
MSTIVSAFISNVNHKYDNNLQRYYELGKLLIQSNTPKIIFVDNTMFELIGENYDKGNTLIIKVDKKQIYLYDYICYLINFRINSTDYKKDTIEFMITMCSKTEWIRMAIELNHFNTENFIWIDYGIRHVFKCSDDLFIEKINNLKFKKYKNIRIGGIWNINSVYNMNIYKDIAWYFAGGVFGGNKDELIQFADTMKLKCIEIMTTKNTIMWEVNIWYLIYNDCKHFLDIYKCDHNDSIIDNY